LLRQSSCILAVIAGSLALFRCQRVEFLTRLFLHLLRSPLVQASVLLLAGSGVLLWQVVVPDFRPLDEYAGYRQRELAQTRLALLPTPALTDVGHPIPIFDAQDIHTDPTLSRDEEFLFQRLKLGSHAIRTNGPVMEYNCHGWVFTGGRHWVRGEAVETILRDNGYSLVAQPRPDDLVVYRDKREQVLHLPENHCYLGSIPQFYHSERVGHLIREPDQPGNPLAAADQAAMR
jgi:hypothetical protein